MKQKRFTSERAIHAEIFAGQRKINALVAEAEKMDTDGRTYLRSGDEGLADAGRGLLQKAERIRVHSIPRIESRLNKLKQALASFKTPLLSGMPGDQGVVL